MCARWGLSRTCLPFLQRKLGPVPCPRVVPAPGRAVQVRRHRAKNVWCILCSCSQSGQIPIFPTSKVLISFSK